MVLWITWGDWALSQRSRWVRSSFGLCVSCGHACGRLCGFWRWRGGGTGCPRSFHRFIHRAGPPPRHALRLCQPRRGGHLRSTRRADPQGRALTAPVARTKHGALVALHQLPAPSAVRREHRLALVRAAELAAPWPRGGRPAFGRIARPHGGPPWHRHRHATRPPDSAGHSMRTQGVQARPSHARQRGESARICAAKVRSLSSVDPLTSPTGRPHAQ